MLYKRKCNWMSTDMIKKCFFNLIFLICGVNNFAQNAAVFEKDFKEKGFSVHLDTYTFFPLEDETDGYFDTKFEIERNTVVYGLNSTLTYFFTPYFGLGMGIGYEYINQPRFSYFPIYLNGIFAFNETKNSYYLRGNYGTFLGNLDKSGVFVRAGIGYRFILAKKLLLNFEILYSFQNMYKTFENSERPENYYNIEGIGIAIGVMFN